MNCKKNLFFLPFFLMIAAAATLLIPTGCKSKAEPKTAAASRFVFDGDTMLIRSARLVSWGKQNYYLFLYLTEDSTSYLFLHANTAKHNQREIDLSKIEGTHRETFNWFVGAVMDRKHRFSATGRYGSRRLFRTGSLRIMADLQTGSYFVSLTGGAMDATSAGAYDERPHTVDIQAEGSATIEVMTEDAVPHFDEDAPVRKTR